MTTTHSPTSTDPWPCPRGCPPEMWASLLESEPSASIPAIWAVLEREAAEDAQPFQRTAGCPAWCVEHMDVGSSRTHLGPERDFGAAETRLQCNEDGVLVYLGDVPDGLLEPSGARRLAAHLVELAAVAESPNASPLTQVRPDPDPARERGHAAWCSDHAYERGFPSDPGFCRHFIRSLGGPLDEDSDDLEVLIENGGDGDGPAVAIRLYGVHGDDALTPAQAGIIAQALLQAQGIVETAELATARNAEGGAA